MKSSTHATLALLLGAQLFGGTAAAATSDAELRRIIDGLREIVRDARRDGSADRRFLNELQAFIDDHDRPAVSVIVSDDFADGELARSPAWRTISGQHTVDRRYGMVGTPGTARASGGSRDQQVVNALLGALLQGGAQSTNRTSGPARIETSARTGNAFDLEVDITGMADQATVRLLLVQGGSGDTGYALTVAPAAQPTLRLTRTVGTRTATVATHGARLRADTNGAYRLGWTRGRSGRMEVTLNGRSVISATDRGLRDGFDRLAVENDGGQVAIGRIVVSSSR